MTIPSATENRLSIAHLMLLTTGIGIAFFVARGIEHVRFAADSNYYGIDKVSEVDAFGMLLSGIYGLSVTVFLLAIRSGNIWSSPGKTLALLFATMCILNWGLDLFAAIVASNRMQTAIEPGTVDRRGYIFGSWYRSFAADFGYALCLPVLLWVQFKTKRQGFLWRSVWAGFLFFAVAIIGYLHFGFGSYLGTRLDAWYFEGAIGVPICLLMAALAYSYARHDPMDWWTIMTAVPVVCAWCFALTAKLFA